MGELLSEKWSDHPISSSKDNEKPTYPKIKNTGHTMLKFASV